MTYRKKLIEVALPLDAINRESAREKSIRHGHPSTLHLWWARRPLAACRAVIFSSLVDDPEQEGVPQELLDAIDALPAPPQGAADAAGSLRRAKLFYLIEELVKWENTTNERLLDTARGIIRAATGGNPPPVLDPFCGGGSIPLEAQRLGLETYASDLNPVAVLVTKALIEIPPKFAGKPPVNPESTKGTGGEAVWRGASGLAADVRYYGKHMRDEAWKRIGHLYPKGPNGETIIAWLWARTVKCPNPACGAQTPLIRSFWLSTKKGKEVWAEPVVDRYASAVRFAVRTGYGKPRNGTVSKKDYNGAICIFCEQPMTFDDIRNAAQKIGLGQIPIAMVAEGHRRRVYYPIDESQTPEIPQAAWKPEIKLEGKTAADVPLYGMTSFADLFTPRQLVALGSFCDLVPEARDLVLEHSGGDDKYADAVTTYLGLAVSRITNTLNSLAIWSPGRDQSKNVFSRQALPMVWDFAEVNPFAKAAGDYGETVDSVGKVLDSMVTFPGMASCPVAQLDASAAMPGTGLTVVVTDPPYYDNVAYADLSDFFYVWLRRSLNKVYPDLFSTLLTPKGPELVATSYRFKGDRRQAEEHFEQGLQKAFNLMRHRAHDDYPVTLYYAFKQSEEDDGNGHGGIGLTRVSTGWETMLSGLLSAGFQVTGTWPMRTERSGRTIGLGANALASSIVIGCRPRQQDVPIATRREFLAALRSELPDELRVLMGGRVAPVDLAQAAIGPGMAVYSRYSRVVEADGSPMTVRTALQEINYVIEDVLVQQEGDLDVESQFCVNWFQEVGTQAGEYGRADILARAKNVAIDNGMSRLGLVESARGRVRLRMREGYQDGWDPRQSPKLTAWEACQRLVWTLQEHGEQETGRLARQLGGTADQARELAFRLYGIADQKGWAEEALGYNSLVASWPEIQKYAAAAAQETQARMV